MLGDGLLVGVLELLVVVLELLVLGLEVVIVSHQLLFLLLYSYLLLALS